MIKKLFLVLLIIFTSFSFVSCSIDDFINTEDPKTENKEEDPKIEEDPSNQEDPKIEEDPSNQEDPKIEEGPSNQEDPKIEEDPSNQEDTGNQGEAPAIEEPKTEESNILTIIEANDVHGYIMQDEDHYYGLSNMAYLIDNIREEVGKDNVLLVANGDMFQGTGIVRMSMGQIMIDAMNEMQFDACCIGNHEFDWDLPTIYNYFDGNKDNGEANFPLINGNVYLNNKLYLDQNVFEYYMFDKAGLKVGFIGFIGDVKSSISDYIANKYDFKTDFTSLTQKIGNKLKELGADVIVLSIHDGNSNGIDKYEVNQQLAVLKDTNGNYLIDAIINGHTHTYQDGFITRDGGTKLPVIQSSGYSSNYLYSFGRIDLHLENKKVVDASCSHLKTSQAKANYNVNVENVIQAYYERDKIALTETLTNASYRISRYGNETKKWVSNVMLAATGADLVIMNSGGIRADIPAGKVTFDSVYQMNPFDNYFIIHRVDASTVEKKILSYDGYIYAYRDGVTKTSKNIKVAVIDYVYYKYYYPQTSNAYTTDFTLRDLLIEDLKLHGSNFNIYNDYEAKIGLKVTNTNISFEVFAIIKKEIICEFV